MGQFESAIGTESFSSVAFNDESNQRKTAQEELDRYLLTLTEQQRNQQANLILASDSTAPLLTGSGIPLVTDLSLQLDSAEVVPVAVTSDNAASTQTTDSTWNRRTENGTIETFNSAGEIVQVETAGQIYLYANGQIVRIEDKSDQTYWAYDDGWRHYQSNGQVFDLPPYDLINYDQIAFQNGVEPKFQTRDGYASITLHADGSKSRGYGNTQNLNFDDQGNLTFVRLPNGRTYNKVGDVWMIDSNFTTTRPSVDEFGAVTLPHNDTHPATESTFRFRPDGSYTIRYSPSAESSGAMFESASAYCLEDGFVVYVSLPDGSYLNHYPGEEPEWQRETMPSNSEQTEANLTFTHNADAQRLPFDGSVLITPEGEIGIRSGNSYGSLFYPNNLGPSSNYTFEDEMTNNLVDQATWALPLPEGGHELHLQNGDSAVVEGRDSTLQSIEYGGIRIEALTNGQITDDTIITLPDDSVITNVNGKWLHTVYDTTVQPTTATSEEISSPELDEFGRLVGITTAQGAYNIRTADGVNEFYLPDRTKITQSQDGTWFAEDDEVFADLIDVSPAGQLVVGKYTVATDGNPYLAISSYNENTRWSEPTLSRLYFDRSEQGQALLVSAVQAIEDNPGILVNELRNMSTADQLILNQAYFLKTGHYLNEVATTLNNSDTTPILTILSRTADGTDLVGQMHRTLVLFDSDREHGEQALLNLLMLSTAEEIEQMRRQYSQLYGFDPFEVLESRHDLSQGVLEVLPLLESGVDLLTGKDSTGRPLLSDAAFLRLSRAALQAHDIDLFAVAFQWSSEAQRERFRASQEFQNIGGIFSGNDLETARDYIDDGSISIDTLVRFNIRPFYIDSGVINSTLENTPATQREQYARGLVQVQAHPDLLTLSEADRPAALERLNLNSDDRADIDYYFAVHDALKRASWNENQIVDFGYSDSPTDTAKFEDRLLHGRPTLISLCLDEIKPYLLGIGGTHYEPTAVLTHLQNMSTDDWNLLRTEPTFKHELTDALKLMLNDQDYALAIGIIDRMAAATTIEAARTAGQLTGLDSVLSAHGRADLTIPAILNLSPADATRYANNDGNIASVIDAQVASLSEPAKTLAISLLASIPESPDANFQIVLDPYQTVIADNIRGTDSATTYLDIQHFLSSTPADCPSYTQLNSLLSAEDMNRTFRDLIVSVPPQSQYMTQSEAIQPRDAALWSLRSQLTNQIYDHMSRSTTGSYLAESWTNAAVEDLLTTGQLPLDLTAGPNLPKPELLDLLLSSSSFEVRSLLTDSNSQLLDLLGPLEREVLLTALSRTTDDQARLELTNAEKLRLYSLGYGTFEQTQSILQSYANDQTGLAAMLQEYSQYDHGNDAGGATAQNLYVDLLEAYGDSDKERLYNLILNAPDAELAKLLDDSLTGTLTEILSPVELEVLRHAIARTQSDPAQVNALDNAELLRLFALGDRGENEQAVIDFLNSLTPGARVAAIYEYSSSFHNENSDAPANLLADMHARFGDHTNVQLDALCSIAPGDQRQMFWDANASVYMRESGWSAYALNNGARDAMQQAQSQYFEDIVRATAEGNINSPEVQARLATDLAHLENSTDAYAEAKQTFTNNTVSLVGTTAVMLLAPYVSLPYLIAGGTIFNIVAKASGLGYDADLSPRALAIETVSSAFSFAALKVGGDIAQGIFRQMFESRIVSAVLAQVDDSFKLFSEAGMISAIERAGLTWDRAALESGLPTLVQTIAAGADDATVMNAAKVIARDMLGLNSEAIVNASYYRFADLVAQGLVREATTAIAQVAIPQLERFAIAVAAYEATGIPAHIAATATTTVIDRWEPNQTVAEVFQNALQGAQAGIDSAPDTAASIIAFVSLGQCVGMLFPAEGNRFSYKNTSTQPQEIPYVPEGGGSPITITVQPNQSLMLRPGDRLMLGPGEAIAAPPGSLFNMPVLFQVPAYELTVPTPVGDHAPINPTQIQGGESLPEELLRIQAVAQVVQDINAMASGTTGNTAGGDTALGNTTGGDTATGDTATGNTTGGDGEVLPFDDLPAKPEAPAAQPDPPTEAQKLSRLERLKQGCRGCLIRTAIAIAVSCGVGTLGLGVLRGVVHNLTEQVQDSMPQLFFPSEGISDAAAILETITSDKINSLPIHHTLPNSNGENIPYLTWQDVLEMPSSDDALANTLMSYFWEVAESQTTSDGTQFVVTEEAIQRFLELNRSAIAVDAAAKENE